ncbi:hypothetical protein BIW11_11192 [Tropilaelaps mercedesae]|uniref:Uncharacterized protein n=1 Tax=Tropilaelaps mercedesae TaxID=418985 RepID=A0A1V9XC58_9ACAR|nr:hypothetical protein BIW11_11192 [Tropilaelaps mercedesae]
MDLHVLVVRGSESGDTLLIVQVPDFDVSMWIFVCHGNLYVSGAVPDSDLVLTVGGFQRHGFARREATATQMIRVATDWTCEANNLHLDHSQMGEFSTKKHDHADVFVVGLSTCVNLASRSHARSLSAPPTDGIRALRLNSIAYAKRDTPNWAFAAETGGVPYRISDLFRVAMAGRYPDAGTVHGQTVGRIVTFAESTTVANAQKKCACVRREYKWDEARSAGGDSGTDIEGTCDARRAAAPHRGVRVSSALAPNSLREQRHQAPLSANSDPEWRSRCR